MDTMKSELRSERGGLHRLVGKVPQEVVTVSIATILLFIASYIFAPATLIGTTLSTMIPFAGMLAIVGVGQTLVIQQRGIDLSVVGVVVLTGILVSKFGYDNLALGLAVSLFAAIVIGLLNGMLVSILSITPLVATLATSALLTAAIQTVSGGFSTISNPNLISFARLQIWGLSVSVFVALAVVVVVSLVLRMTVVGRRFVAVGANPAAARAAAISTLPYQIGTYVAASVIYSITGLLLAGYIGTAYTNSGSEYVLSSIAVVVIGGTPFTGGSGTVVGTAIASIFITQLGQLVLALGAPTSMQLMIQAVAIVVATTLRSMIFGRAR